jgi:hypothetical protein
MTLVLSYGALVAITIFLLSGAGLSPSLRRLARVAGVYAFLAFVVRSAELLIFNPFPSYSSVLAFAPLASPSYATGLASVLPIEVIGLSTFTFGLMILDRLRWKRVEDVVLTPLDDVLMRRLYWTSAILHGLERGVHVLSSSSHVVGNLLSHLAATSTTCFVLYVICVDWRRSRHSRRFVLAAASCEVLFGLLSASKTPLLVVVLALYLDPKRKRLTSRQLLVAIMAAVFAFGFVQSLKPRAADKVTTTNPFSSVGKEITARFDGLLALTGSFQNGAGSLGNQYFVDSLTANLLPQAIVGQPKRLSGVVWGEKIYHLHSGTSYAEGFTPEGYAVHGILGVVLWNMAGAAALVVVAKRTRAGPLWIRFFFGTILASTGLFERGLLGLIESVSGGVQVALFVFILQFAVRPRHLNPMSGAMPERAMSTGGQILRASADRISTR